jgi:hypothetical protein
VIETIPPGGGDGTLVLDAIARKYGISRADICARTQSRRCSWPRHEAMRVLRDDYGWDYNRIAALFGWCDQTTAVRGVQGARERQGQLFSVAERKKIERRVIRNAASQHGVPPSELRSRSHTKPIVKARDRAMRVLREQYGYALYQIAEVFQVQRKAVRDSISRASGEAARRRAERAATQRRTLTLEEIERAIQLRDEGESIYAASRAMVICPKVLLRELTDAGIHWQSYAGSLRGIKGSNDPIGSVPPGHALYELDQQILRARQRQPVVSGWRQSSLADVG